MCPITWPVVKVSGKLRQPNSGKITSVPDPFVNHFFPLYYVFVSCLRNYLYPNIMKTFSYGFFLETLPF